MVPADLTLTDLLAELSIARHHSLALITDLDADQIAWRPHDDSSAIGWHLGHQAAVEHYMVRNLTAAQPSFDLALDRLFDSATPERDRGSLPAVDGLLAYRTAIASSTERTIGRIIAGDVGAPAQLRIVAAGLLRALTIHEYQHATWIAEVRAGLTDAPTPTPDSTDLIEIDGYPLPR